VIPAHVLAADVLSIDAKEATTINEKRERLIHWFVGGRRRRRRGLLRGYDTRSQN
jgi:hypothetical protein